MWVLGPILGLLEEQIVLLTTETELYLQFMCKRLHVCVHTRACTCVHACGVVNVSACLSVWSRVNE